MLGIYIFLFAILLFAIWIKLNDGDPIHNIAATTAGAIAVIWGFILSPALVKVLVLLIIWFVLHRFKPTYR